MPMRSRNRRRRGKKMKEWQKKEMKTRPIEARRNQKKRNDMKRKGSNGWNTKNKMEMTKERKGKNRAVGNKEGKNKI